MPKDGRKEKVRVVESWDDWKGENTAWIEFPRPDGSVDRFLCRGLSGEDLDYVEKQCTPPTPPKKPRYGSDNKPVIIGGKTQSEPDYEDAEYKKLLMEYSSKRVVLLLEKGLVKPDGKKMPGNNWQEKFANLNKKLRGDVLKLANFINIDLSNLSQSDVNLF